MAHRRATPRSRTVALAALLAAATAAAKPGGSPAHPGAGPKHNCGRPWWESVAAFLGSDDWPQSKRDWCCKHENVGCGGPTAAPKQYDCRKDYEKREQVWSEQQTTWCCKHHRLGCKAAAWSTEPYNCHEDLDNWQEDWPVSKKTWCCEFEGLGCKTVTRTTSNTTTTTQPFDCRANLSRWRTEWPAPKRQWCCRHHGLGCAPAAAPEPSPEAYDCQAALSNWDAAWSPSKKRWCCANKRVGCLRETTTTATRTTTEPYNCSNGSLGASSRWSSARRNWCCRRHGTGCTTTTRTSTSTTATKPFVCEDLPRSKQQAWPERKRRWCCKHERKGCTDCDAACVVEGFPASCRSRIEWLESHNLQFQESACARSHGAVLGQCPTCIRCSLSDACPALANHTDSYSCEPNSLNHEDSWSEAHKNWCCMSYNRGCPITTTTTTSTPRTYNCHVGAANWEEGWSDEKKVYCCKTALVGCTSCDVSCVVDGLSASCRDRIVWLQGHDLKREPDACAGAHSQVLEQCHTCGSCAASDACPAPGTTALPHDCQAGLSRWRTSWTSAKKTWCCSHEGLGCEDVVSEQVDSAVADDYDCSTESSAWPSDQRDWCCAHRSTGCSFEVMREATSTTLPPGQMYNCQADVLHWHSGWSDSKKDWCCKHFSLGCSSSTLAAEPSSQPYDCQADYVHWRQAWASAKKAWCCDNYFMGCPETTTAAAASRKPHDCEAVLADPEQDWPEERRRWCAQSAAAPAGLSQEVPSLTWSGRRALPKVEGDPLFGFSQSVGSLQGMKRWCEEKSDCVGFAMQPDTMRWFPKVAGTGFDPRTAVYGPEKLLGQEWRWYFIQERAVAAPVQAREKFQQGPGPVLQTAAGRAQAPLAAGCLGLVAAFAAARAFAGSRRTFRGCAGAYTSLGPARMEEAPLAGADWEAAGTLE